MKSQIITFYYQETEDLRLTYLDPNKRSLTFRVANHFPVGYRRRDTICGGPKGKGKVLQMLDQLVSQKNQPTNRVPRNYPKMIVVS